MSGGFFRGTSAEQDTRFSNKQAKLLKSQKFAPELDILVDISKVKMDVMKPWIANKVTVLLGFEDEVLINFVYGLLDGRNVNGKEVQISLTGFMEKNTGKFMKELWTLLLSAQKNTSGVPQQFLDAKEEETRMMKAESDRITGEIEWRKEAEKNEQAQGPHKRMEGDTDGLLANLNWHCNDEKVNAQRSDSRMGFGPRDAIVAIGRGISGFSSPARRNSPADDRRRRRSASRSPLLRRRRTGRRRDVSPVRSRPRHDSESPSRSPVLRRPLSPPARRRRVSTPSPVRRRRRRRGSTPSPVRRRHRRSTPSPVHCRHRRPRSPSSSPSRRRRHASPPRHRTSPPSTAAVDEKSAEGLAEENANGFENSNPTRPSPLPPSVNERGDDGGGGHDDGGGGHDDGDGRSGSGGEEAVSAAPAGDDSEQKLLLEMQLRNRALECIRAKKMMRQQQQPSSATH